MVDQPRTVPPRRASGREDGGTRRRQVQVNQIQRCATNTRTRRCQAPRSPLMLHRSIDVSPTPSDLTTTGNTIHEIAGSLALIGSFELLMYGDQYPCEIIQPFADYFEVFVDLIEFLGSIVHSIHVFPFQPILRISSCPMFFVALANESRISSRWSTACATDNHRPEVLDGAVPPCPYLVSDE